MVLGEKKGAVPRAGGASNDWNERRSMQVAPGMAKIVIYAYSVLYQASEDDIYYIYQDLA